MFRDKNGYFVYVKDLLKSYMYNYYTIVNIDVEKVKKYIMSEQFYIYLFININYIFNIIRHSIFIRIKIPR